MENMETQFTFRSNSLVDNMVDELMRLHPERYDSKAHTVRCAIIKLYKKEVDEYVKRKG